MQALGFVIAGLGFRTSSLRILQCKLRGNWSVQALAFSLQPWDFSVQALKQFLIAGRRLSKCRLRLSLFALLVLFYSKHFSLLCVLFRVW